MVKRSPPEPDQIFNTLLTQQVWHIAIAYRDGAPPDIECKTSVGNLEISVQAEQFLRTKGLEVERDQQSGKVEWIRTSNPKAIKALLEQKLQAHEALAMPRARSLFERNPPARIEPTPWILTVQDTPQFFEPDTSSNATYPRKTTDELIGILASCGITTHTRGLLKSTRNGDKLFNIIYEGLAPAVNVSYVRSIDASCPAANVSPPSYAPPRPQR